MSPSVFSKTIVGDFLDAMAGYNEGEMDRVKAIGNIVRSATLALWNVQVIEEDRLSNPEDLWKYPWEVERVISPAEKSKEETEFEERQKKYLQDNFPG